MRYLSLFSGIEAASTAWEPLGWQCAGFSEIEPGPCRLLAKRYPNVPNLGDVTKITEFDIAMLGQLDLLVFGSPCQDLSVAGKQKGLSGARSGLFHTAINIVRWARIHCGLRWALWENVPGAFTSNKGADFAVVVALLGGDAEPAAIPAKTKQWKGGWGNEGCYIGAEAMVEWSTLDAQWFGVAQRRRRVFALADFGDWAGRPPVLLEPQGMRGDSAPRRGTQEDAPPRAAGGAGTHGAGPVVATLDANYGRLQGCSGQDLNHGHSHIVVDTLTGGGRRRGGYSYDDVPLVAAFGGNNTSGSIEVAPALLAKGGSGHGDFETETFVVQGAAGSVQSHHNMVGTLTTNCDRVSGSAPAIVAYMPSRTLAPDGGVDERFAERDISDALHCSSGSGNKVPLVIAFDCKSSGQNGFGVGVEVAGTQRAMGHANSHTNGGGHQAVLVAYTTKLHNTKANNAGKLFAERTPCLDANSPASALLGVGRPRRLTPLECERLQAFPDHYTALIGAADGPRYKALGNSMCVNVMRWIGRKVDFVHEFC